MSSVFYVFCHFCVEMTLTLGDIQSSKVGFVGVGLKIVQMYHNAQLTGDAGWH